MSQYASRTTVPVQQTIQEIERALRKYGANAFHFGSDDDAGYAVIGFRIKERQVKMRLPMPKKETYNRGWQTKYEQAERQRYRALLLVVKAKLEAVESGITTIEREFLPDVVLSTGQTVAEVLAPQIEDMYRTGRVPSLLEGHARPVGLLEGTVVE